MAMAVQQNFQDELPSVGDVYHMNHAEIVIFLLRNTDVKPNDDKNLWDVPLHDLRTQVLGLVA